MEVAKAFPEYPVTPVKVNGPLHLKHYVCLASPNVLAVGNSKEAQNILKRIEREATFRYQTLTLNDDGGVNCLNVNGTLLFRPDFHACVEKFGTLQDTHLCPVTITELTKLGGMLSQHCIMFRRIKLLKNIWEIIDRKIRLLKKQNSEWEYFFCHYFKFSSFDSNCFWWKWFFDDERTFILYCFYNWRRSFFASIRFLL